MAVLCRAVPFPLPAGGSGGAGRCRVAVPGAAEPGVPAGGGAARSMEKLNKLAVPAGEKLRYGLGPPQTPPRVGQSGAAGHLRARSAAGSRGAASCTGGETLGGYRDTGVTGTRGGTQGHGQRPWGYTRSSPRPCGEVQDGSVEVTWWLLRRQSRGKGFKSLFAKV